VIRTRHKTAEINQAPGAFNFMVNRFPVYRQSIFPDVSHTAEFFSKFFAHSFKVVFPGAVLYGKHGIDAVVEPCGNQVVNITVAINRDNIYSVFGAFVGDPPVMGPYFSPEYFRLYQRSVVITDIFPKMSKVRFYPGLQCFFGYPITGFRYVVYALVKQIRVIKLEFAYTDQSPVIPPFPKQAAAKYAGMAFPCVICFYKFFNSGFIKPFVVPCEPRNVILFPAFAVLRRMVDFLGNGSNALSGFYKYAVPVKFYKSATEPSIELFPRLRIGSISSCFKRPSLTHFSRVSCQKPKCSMGMRS
jgi:hypothetical protein